MIKYLLFKHFYKKKFVKRYDDNHIIHYYSYLDFPSLEAKSLDFISNSNYRIRGYFYNYPNYKKDHLVIFCHGLGGGHRSYMKEIEVLCRNGYQVFAYDNVGCFESDGKTCRGFTESLNNLHSCLIFLNSTGALNNKKVSLIGHSWGAYAVSNILNYYKDIYSITSISGFNSIRSFGEIAFPNVKNELYKFEKKANPNYVDSSSVDAFKDTNTKVLIIHSKDDKIVPFNVGAGLLQKKVDNPNVKYLIVDNKNHNPNYTVDAVKCLNETLALYNKNINKYKTLEEKQKFANTFDYERMTMQDEEVWKSILDNLK